MFATRVRIRRRSFATARSIAKLKPPLCSAESKLPIGVKIPFSTKCGEWVIYAELVTYTQPIFEVTNCVITRKFFEQCLVGGSQWTSQGLGTINMSYNQGHGGVWMILKALIGQKKHSMTMWPPKKIMPHSRARRRTVIKEADPANQEKAWDHCYVTGWKWWTRL